MEKSSAKDPPRIPPEDLARLNAMRDRLVKLEEDELIDETVNQLLQQGGNSSRFTDIEEEVLEWKQAKMIRICALATLENEKNRERVEEAIVKSTQTGPANLQAKPVKIGHVRADVYDMSFRPKNVGSLHIGARKHRPMMRKPVTNGNRFLTPPQEPAYASIISLSSSSENAEKPGSQAIDGPSSGSSFTFNISVPFEMKIDPKIPDNMSFNRDKGGHLQPSILGSTPQLFENRFKTPEYALDPLLAEMVDTAHLPTSEESIQPIQECPSPSGHLSAPIATFAESPQQEEQQPKIDVFRAGAFSLSPKGEMVTERIDDIPFSTQPAVHAHDQNVINSALQNLVVGEPSDRKHFEKLYKDEKNRCALQGTLLSAEKLKSAELERQLQESKEHTDFNFNQLWDIWGQMPTELQIAINDNQITLNDAVAQQFQGIEAMYKSEAVESERLRNDIAAQNMQMSGASARFQSLQEETQSRSEQLAAANEIIREQTQQLAAANELIREKTENFTITARNEEQRVEEVNCAIREQLSIVQLELEGTQEQLHQSQEAIRNTDKAYQRLLDSKVALETELAEVKIHLPQMEKNIEGLQCEILRLTFRADTAESHLGTATLQLEQAVQNIYIQEQEVSGQRARAETAENDLISRHRELSRTKTEAESLKSVNSQLTMDNAKLTASITKLMTSQEDFKQEKGTLLQSADRTEQGLKTRIAALETSVQTSSQKSQKLTEKNHQLLVTNGNLKEAAASVKSSTNTLKANHAAQLKRLEENLKVKNTLIQNLQWSLKSLQKASCEAALPITEPTNTQIEAIIPVPRVLKQTDISATTTPDPITTTKKKNKKNQNRRRRPAKNERASNTQDSGDAGDAGDFDDGDDGDDVEDSDGTGKVESGSLNLCDLVVEEKPYIGEADFQTVTKSKGRRAHILDELTGDVRPVKTELSRKMIREILGDKSSPVIENLDETIVLESIEVIDEPSKDIPQEKAVVMDSITDKEGASDKTEMEDRNQVIEILLSANTELSLMNLVAKETYHQTVPIDLMKEKDIDEKLDVQGDSPVNAAESIRLHEVKLVESGKSLVGVPEDPVIIYSQDTKSRAKKSKENDKMKKTTAYNLVILAVLLTLFAQELLVYGYYAGVRFMTYGGSGNSEQAQVLTIDSKPYNKNLFSVTTSQVSASVDNDSHLEIAGLMMTSVKTIIEWDNGNTCENIQVFKVEHGFTLESPVPTTQPSEIPSVTPVSKNEQIASPVVSAIVVTAKKDMQPRKSLLVRQRLQKIYATSSVSVRSSWKGYSGILAEKCATFRAVITGAYLALLGAAAQIGVRHLFDC